MTTSRRVARAVKKRLRKSGESICARPEATRVGARRRLSGACLYMTAPWMESNKETAQ